MDDGCSGRSVKRPEAPAPTQPRWARGWSLPSRRRLRARRHPSSNRSLTC